MIIPQEGQESVNVTISLPASLAMARIERTIYRGEAALIPLPASVRMFPGVIDNKGK